MSESLNEFKGHVPYTDLGESTVDTWKGTFAAAFGLVPLDIDCADDVHLEKIGASLSRVLNDLKTDFTYKIIARNYNDSGQFKKCFRIWVQDSQVRNTAQRIRFLNSKQSLELIEENLASKRHRFEEEVKRIGQLLTDSGFQPERLNREQLFAELRSFFRPDLKLASPHLISLRRADLLIKENLFFYDHTFWGGLSISEFPDIVSTGHLISGLVSDADSICCVSIKPCDSNKIAERLKQKRKISASLTNTNSRLRDHESEARLESEDELLDKLIVGQEKVFECQISSFVCALDPSFVSLKLRKLEEQIQALGYQTYREAISLYPVFQSCLPGMSPEKSRTQLLPTSCVQAVLPVFNTDRGHKRPVLSFHDRFDTQVTIDPWDDSLSSFNCVICGTSGSGKSFFSNLYLKNLTEFEPVSIFIIDIGGSYRRLTKLKSGDYYTFDVKGSNAFNPLGKIDKRDPASIEAATDVLAAILSDDNNPLTRLERSILLQELTELSSQEITLSVLRQKWLKSKVPFLQECATVLFRWTEDRPYGILLDTNKILDPKGTWTTFDLLGLNDHPDLQRVIMLSIVKRVWEIIRYREGRKVLLLDEVWALVRNYSGFIGEAFRTFRKHNASAIAVTQSLEDIATESLTSAVLNNTPTKIILKQSIKPDRLQKLLDLNSRETEIVSRLKSIKGKYSEFFMLNGDKKRFLRLEPQPFDYWLSTTNAQDIEFINHFMKLRPELNELQACQEISKLYGRNRP